MPMGKRILIGIGAVVLAATIMAGGFAYLETRKSREIQEKTKGYRSFSLRPRPVIDKTWTRYRCPEDKIAGFDFSDGAQVEEAEALLNTYGTGCADKTEDTHGRRLRYYVPKSKTYVELDIENNCGKNGCLVNVKLAREAIFPRTCVPKADFKSLSTGKGIQLGDSEDKVRKLYGLPFSEGKLADKPGRFYAFYSDLAVSPDKDVPPEGIPPGHAMRFIFQDYKVFSIEFIAGE